MVYVINESKTDFNSFIHETELIVQDAIHEFKYSILLDKYNYLVENGTLLENSNNSIFQHIKTFVNKIVAAIKEIGKKFVAKAKEILGKLRKKDKASGNDVKKIEETIDKSNTIVKDAEVEVYSSMEEARRASTNPSDNSTQFYDDFTEQSKQILNSVIENHRKLDEALAQLDKNMAEHEKHKQELNDEIDEIMNSINKKLEGFKS